MPYDGFFMVGHDLFPFGPLEFHSSAQYSVQSRCKSLRLLKISESTQFVFDVSELNKSIFHLLYGKIMSVPRFWRIITINDPLNLRICLENHSNSVKRSQEENY